MGVKHSYTYIKEFVNKKGYILISDSYENAHQKLIAKDNEGYFYQFTFNKLQMGRSPSKFGRNNPYTIDNIKNYLKINGYSCELISNEYKTNKEKLSWKCICGDIFERSLDGMLASNGVCLKCAGQSKYTMDEIYSISKSKGLTPLFNEYKNVSQKLEFITNEGYKVQTSIETLTRYKNDYKRIFHTSNKYSLENIKHFLMINNIKTTLISTEYINSKNNLLWKCGQCGCTYENSLMNFCDSSYICPKCSAKNGYEKLKLTKEYIKEYIEENTEYSLIEIEEDGLNSELKVRCSCGNEYKIKFINIRYGSNRCKVCSGKTSYGEYFTEKILKEFNIDFITQYKFDDCKCDNFLYFDFYLPKYKTCIEIDGEQHRKPIGIFGGEEEFIKTKLRDGKKNLYCKDNNINLIRVDYYSDNKNKFERNVKDIIKSLIE